MQRVTRDLCCQGSERTWTTEPFSSLESIGAPQMPFVGEDLKCMIARVVTCGDFSLQACVQTFVGVPIQDSVQQWCPSEPLHWHTTHQMACNYNESLRTR